MGGPSGCGDPAAPGHGGLGVPTEAIPRLRYPTELTPERFEEEFVSRNRAVIIEGLVDDWPASQEGPSCWRGRRWAEALGDQVFECNFDPADNRMYRFEDGNPSVLLNPGRLRFTHSTFQEVADVRAEILRLLQTGGPEGAGLDLRLHPELRERLNARVDVQNVPLSVEPGTPLQFFVPFKVRIRDLVPLVFYMATDYYALPAELQGDVRPQNLKLLPAWGEPSMSRCWITPGGLWRAPSPPWSSDACPQPSEDQRIYSCFHFDRMENLHTVLAGEKEVFLIAHRDAHVLKGTRYSAQKQWVVAPVPSSAGGDPYLGPSLMTCKLNECVSDQSAVNPLRSARENELASCGQWPNSVAAPVRHGWLRKGDTLYIPAHHWHFVASASPPALGNHSDGPTCCSINFWWWPIHGKEEKRRWTMENEVWSRANARIGDPREMLAALGDPAEVMARIAGCQAPVAAAAPETFERVD